MSADRRSVEAWLADIVFWGRRAARHVEGATFEAFIHDELRQDASVKCIENIGEAAGSILRADAEFEAKHREIALSAAYRARNRLAHGYFSIDQAVVWHTITVSMPQIVEAAQTILDNWEPGS